MSEVIGDIELCLVLLISLAKVKDQLHSLHLISMLTRVSMSFYLDYFSSLSRLFHAITYLDKFKRLCMILLSILILLDCVVLLN